MGRTGRRGVHGQRPRRRTHRARRGRQAVQARRDAGRRARMVVADGPAVVIGSRAGPLLTVAVAADDPVAAAIDEAAPGRAAVCGSARRGGRGRFARPRLALLQRLQHGRSQLRRRHRVLQDRHRAQPQCLLGTLGVQPGEQQDHRDVAMLAPDVREEFQRITVARIDPREDQIDVLPLHQTDRHPIIGGFLDDMAERLQHRSQQGQSRGIGVEDQDSELVHGIHSRIRCPCRGTRPVRPP